MIKNFLIEKRVVQKVVILVFLITSYYLLITFAIAQTNPEFLVSWRAINYVPADYQGKIFPSKSSLIEAGFDLVGGNKIVNLSRNEIRWLLDNELIASGKGLQSIKFNTKKSGGNEHSIRIEVSDYKGEEIEHTFKILVAKPEVIIDTKYPSSQIPLGNYIFQALPYFFNINNISNLSFTWLANNQPVQGEAQNRDFLNLNLQSKDKPYETQLNVTITAQNLFNQLELAIKKLNLVIR